MKHCALTHSLSLAAVTVHVCALHCTLQAAKASDWLTEGSNRLEHVGFGVVQGDEGKNSKTRAGTSKDW
jgi:hypothetical protein